MDRKQKREDTQLLFASTFRCFLVVLMYWLPQPEVEFRYQVLEEALRMDLDLSKSPLQTHEDDAKVCLSKKPLPPKPKAFPKPKNTRGLQAHKRKILPSPSVLSLYRAVGLGIRSRLKRLDGGSWAPSGLQSSRTWPGHLGGPGGFWGFGFLFSSEPGGSGS